MPKDHFITILKKKNLHFQNKKEADDRLYKLRPVTDVFKWTFKSVHTPDRNIVTDESLVKFKGFLKFQQMKTLQKEHALESRFTKCLKAVGQGWDIHMPSGYILVRISPTYRHLDLNTDLFGNGYNIGINNLPRSIWCPSQTELQCFWYCPEGQEIHPGWFEDSEIAPQWSSILFHWGQTDGVGVEGQQGCVHVVN